MRTPLINRSQVKQLALDTAKQSRARQFCRISGRFLEDCNAHVAAFIRQRVHTAPSRGKTL